MDVEWGRFQELQKNRFNSQAIKCELLAKLYGYKQGEKESVGTFLEQKYLLFSRVRLDETEESKIKTLIGLVRSTIRKLLRQQTIDNYTMLLTKAL